ncbi:ScbR family autoregulator-binding transcription factor [Streptomyces sp. NPDC006879]|uniref:ScbR family autoregulator-binding transcription factor n=1 Tax=Streptomyces sp. NPDC006879 TaxID=3364767 RepID=UPI0036811D29
MAKQDRGVRTRLTILEAAALVFDKKGFQAATINDILGQAGVTKGAFYFHFESKDAVALAILDAQLPVTELVPDRTIALQKIADVGFLHGALITHDPLVRGSVRLAMSPMPGPVDQRQPFRGWHDFTTRVLNQAREEGELLPHVVIEDVADLVVGTFAGVQMTSSIMSDYRDLPHRLVVLMQHVMSSVAVPAVLARLDLTDDRGERLYAEVMATLAARECVAAHT